MCLSFNLQVSAQSADQYDYDYGLDPIHMDPMDLSDSDNDDLDSNLSVHDDVSKVRWNHFFQMSQTSEKQ